MPSTICESFWGPLDDLPSTAVQNGYRAFASTSASTQDTDVPTPWLVQSYKDLTGLAHAKLPPTAPSTGTLWERMPQLGRTHFLHTEAALRSCNVVVSRLLNTEILDCRGELSATGVTDARTLIKRRHVVLISMANRFIIILLTLHQPQLQILEPKTRQSISLSRETVSIHTSYKRKITLNLGFSIIIPNFIFLPCLVLTEEWKRIEELL